MTLRFLTGGESHGRGFLVIIEGLPAGLRVDMERIRGELARRRRGYGRGERMKLERDSVTLWSGVRDGYTTGAPVGLVLENTEWEKWRGVLDPQKVDEEAAASRAISRPRPGHADLAGAVKFGHRDMRNVLERSSARSTAALTIAGTVARLLLEEVGVAVRGAVTSIGGVAVSPPRNGDEWRYAMTSDLGCPRRKDEAALIGRIEEVREEGESLGGVFQISVDGLPAGIGCNSEWDRRIDGRLAGALMAIPAIKGVEVGGGFSLADLPGSEVHDEILPGRDRWIRPTNNAGGIEGGMTNGEEVSLRVAMKPIPTMRKPLRSLDVETGEAVSAHFERSDACAVSAACVVGEAMTAWVVASNVLEQFGGDRMADLEERLAAFRRRGEEFIHGGK